MATRPVVTSTLLETGLRSLGLGLGDAVEVHSSLSAFGWVEGGAPTVVDALMHVVGTEGTLVMSAYRVSGDIPLTEAERARGIHWKVKVLPEHSPEPSGLGAIIAEFVRREGVVCGGGILQVCAWGRDANQHQHGYQYLLDIDGWTLLLGVGIDACSSLHLVEEVGLPEQIQAYYQIPEDIRRDYDPNEWSIGYGGTPANAWAKVYAAGERQGLIRHHQIGNAACQLFKARAMVDLYKEWRRTDPFGLFGVPQDNEDAERQ